MRAVWSGLANRHKRNRIFQRRVCGPDHSALEAIENSRWTTSFLQKLLASGTS